MMEGTPRSPRLAVLPALAALLLVTGLMMLGTGSARAASTPSGMIQVSQTSHTGQASGGETCALYDSWCAYCTRAPQTTACKDIVPAHMTGTKLGGAKNDAGNNFVPGVNVGSSTPGMPSAVIEPMPSGTP